MTFEEFFTKKKIDLKALKAADEPLFEEFRAHYSAMGEKSFDHSKKFWFNKLRKSYHLAEEETVVIKKPIQTDPVETAPAATDATATKPAGFKPRFKAATPTTEPAEQKEEHTTESSTAAANSTAGFKPRFKPGITKNTAATAETSAPTDLSNDTAPETAKPTGFKPRFKPGVTKAADSTVNEDTSSPTEPSDSSATEAPKPTGFKPRFKAGLTKAAEPVQPVSSTFDEAGPANPSIEPQQENIAETDATAANKPAGFKPRFKPGVTKAENTDSSQTKAAPVENTVDKQQKEPGEQETTIAKPTGFTPRFKAGITKAANTDDKRADEPIQSADSSVADATVPSVAADSTVTANTSLPAEASGSSATETSKPTGFKPRFKAGVTKTASTDSSSTVVPSAEDTSEEQTAEPASKAAPTLTESNAVNPPVEPQQNDNAIQEQTATNKPTGFKPRFKAGLTKIDKKEE